MFTKPAKGTSTRARRAAKRSAYERFLDATWRYHTGRANRLPCARCGVWAWRGINAEVDHIKPKSTHPDLRFEVRNTRITCIACNRWYKTHPEER